MSTQEFAGGTIIIVVAMLAVAVLEIALPLRAAAGRPSRRRAVNLWLMGTTLLLNWVLTGAAAALAVGLGWQGTGILARTALPPIVQLVIGIAVLDCCFGYLAHRALHASPWLWRVHRVHHGDPMVDVTTTYRTHPFEVVWRFAFMIAPVLLLGIPAESVVLYRLLSAINGMLEHANLRC